MINDKEAYTVFFMITAERGGGGENGDKIYAPVTF